MVFLWSDYLAAQNHPDGKLRIIAFGAHPDDAELKAGGVATMWASQGHKVKFVAMTNGDIGHFKEAGAPLANRRRAEVGECARIFGIETEVLDIHDGELMPTLENRRKVADLIREWQADIVLCHRTNDYHPDHRYTGELVQDASVVVVAPFFSTNTDPTKKNPVFMFYSDGFKKPYPFDPAIVVDIGSVAEKKWDCIGAMPSQFADEHSWQASYGADVPKDPAGRKAHILESVKKSNEAVADQHRDLLISLYGEARGKAVKYAEAFELCQYGTQLSTQRLKALFPGF
ncbi:MAG: PIG-L family deacetylase [Saprospiraceae bacterium]|nr:PIG-L family deacetylase [Saprospiraceae bacterium]